MTQWRSYGIGGSTIDGVDVFTSLNGNAVSTEAPTQAKQYTAFTFSDLACYTAGASVSTKRFALAINGTQSTNLIVNPNSSTTLFEDLTGSDTVSVNDLVCFDQEDDGMHGDSFSISITAITFEHASVNTPPHIGSSTTTSSTAYPTLIAASAFASTEVEAQVKVRRSQSFNNLRIYITEFPVSGTFSLRKNGSTSLNVTLVPTSTGAFEDLTGSESYVADDLINYIITAVGGGLAVNVRQVDANTAEMLWTGGKQQNVSSVASINIELAAVSNGIADNVMPNRCGSQNAANLMFYVTTYGGATVTATLRKNGSNSSNLTTTPTGTGVFEDLTGSESIADSDKVTFRFESTNATQTTFRIYSIELPWSSVAPPVAFPFQSHYPWYNRQLLAMGY